jgi:hypothetical protein
MSFKLILSKKNRVVNQHILEYTPIPHRTVHQTLSIYNSKIILSKFNFYVPKYSKIYSALE